MPDKIPDMNQILEWFEKLNIGTAFKKKFIEAHTTNSRKSAIRAMCGACMGGSVKGVKECTSPSCPLYRFRING